MSEPKQLVLTEALTMHNATVALRQGAAAIDAGQTVFDLAGVAAADSSAVAVLLEWQRAAGRSGRTLVFTNLPASLKSLMVLYGVDVFLADPPTASSTESPHH